MGIETELAVRKPKKPRGKGKPFVKNDPRIQAGLGSNLSREALQAPMKFRNALIKLLPADEFAQIIMEGIKRNRPGYKEFYGKYILGEPVQKHEIVQDVRLTFEYGSTDEESGE